MNTKQYGKIINGVLMKAPSRIYDGDNLYCGVPHEIYAKYGYKPINFIAQPTDIPPGTRPTFVWKEGDENIEQIWSFESMSEDYAEQLRKSKGRFNLTLLEIKSGIQSYCKQKSDEMNAAICQDEVIKKAYENLTKGVCCSNISEAMKKYQQSIPRDFFSEVGISDYLRNDGFNINTSGDLLFFESQNLYYPTSDISIFDFENGRVYKKDTGKRVYPVDAFAAVKFTESEEPVIIEPMILFFQLQKISELFDSFHKPNLYFTMVFTYLHTIMDDFITNLIRFYVSSYPQGTGLAKNINATDVLALSTIEDLMNLKSSIIDEKVASIGHESYREKIEFLIKRGLEFTISSTEWFDNMIWFCEKRNAIVHNASIINSTVMRKIEGTIHHQNVQIGENISPDYHSLMEAVDLVEKVCNDIYGVAKSKYKF